MLSNGTESFDQTILKKKLNQNDFRTYQVLRRFGQVYLDFFSLGQKLQFDIETIKSQLKFVASKLAKNEPKNDHFTI